MTIIEQIKAEIKRRIKKYRDDGFGCHANSLEKFLSFLDTLEESAKGQPIFEEQEEPEYYQHFDPDC